MCDCEKDSESNEKIKKEFGWDTKVTICAPMNNDMRPIIPSSCLTAAALMRIVDSWNHIHTQEPINVTKIKNANELYSLVEQKMKQKYGCDTEDCWVNSLEHPHGARENLLSFFKPEYPFKNNPHEWWSSSQIDRVIRPYIYSHPFYWCGVVPLDFKEQRKMKLCLSKEVCAVDLRELVDRGCQLVGAIFNLDYSYDSGSHWVLGLVDITRGNVCFMDSYGYEPLVLIKEWMDNCSNTLNQLALKDKWENCDSYILRLKSITFKSNQEIKVKQSIPNHLKIDEGMIMRSCVTGSKYILKEQLGRKHFRLCAATKKREREGEWEFIGARTFTLSKRIQRTGTECGSYCIHTLLESLQGKSWKQIMKEMPGDYKIRQLREKLHRS